MHKIKILTIVGARPQIIKAAALSRTIRTVYPEIREILLHTGQHYDNNLSGAFFDELQIPRPEINLDIGSATHGKQTAAMLQGIEVVAVREKPDFIVVYGDTNSTLAGALAGAKLHIPVAHIEAGLRSFNKTMPEEINRITCDHSSTLLFAPTSSAIRNLEREGFSIQNKHPFTIDNPGVFHCGDIMYDNLLLFERSIEKNAPYLSEIGIHSGNYILCTIHRENNTDNIHNMLEILSSLVQIGKDTELQIIFPIHPRTRKSIINLVDTETQKQFFNNKHIKVIDPVPYFKMLVLEKHSRIILTDSGGVQKEAYFFRKPLVIAREETEWTEIIDAGAGKLTGASAENISRTVHGFVNQAVIHFPPLFGDGHTADFICRKLLACRTA